MKAKIRLTENITFMALFSAINVIAALLAMFFPGFSLILILILPLISAVVTIYTREKYYFIYAIATIFLSLLITMENMETTIFYVIPGVITGFIFGVMLRRNIPGQWIILAVSAIQMGLTYLSLPLINFIYQINMIDFFLTLFKLNNHPSIQSIIPLFILMLSLAQTTFSYMIISEDLPKLGIRANETCWRFNHISAIILFAIGTPFAWFLPALAFIFWAIGVYFSVLAINESLSLNQRMVIAPIFIGLIITLFAGALLAENGPNSLIVYLSAIPLFSADIYLLFKQCLRKKPNSTRI